MVIKIPLRRELNVFLVLLLVFFMSISSVLATTSISKAFPTSGFYFPLDISVHNFFHKGPINYFVNTYSDGVPVIPNSCQYYLVPDPESADGACWDCAASVSLSPPGCYVSISTTNNYNLAFSALVNGIPTYPLEEDWIYSNYDATAPTCGTWNPSESPWKSFGTQTFTLSGSTDSGSGINVAGGSCITGSTQGSTCSVTVSDKIGNTQVCTSPINRVDSIAPTISASGSSTTWSKTQITAVPSVEDNGSGLAEMRYSWNTNSMNSACTSGGTTFFARGALFPAPVGENKLYLCARDTAGNVGTWNGLYKWESTAPTCGTWNPSESPWKSFGTQTFTLSGSTDSGSGINVAGGSCATSSLHGSTCSVTISDNAANTQVCTSPINRVDSSIPLVSNITIYSGTTSGNEWFKGPINIRALVTILGDSGLNTSSCQVKINDADWTSSGTTYDSGYCRYLNYLPNSNFNIGFRILNYVGTYGVSSIKSFFYDNDPPILNATSSSSDWFNYPRNATIYAFDAGSGLSHVKYSWGNNTLGENCTNGGTTSNGATLNSPTEGTTLYLCAKDNLANIITWEGTYNWDATSPIVSIISPLSIVYNTTTHLVNISATDNIGVSSIWYSWNETNSTYTGAHSVTFDNETYSRNYTFYAWANDTSGNIGYDSIVFSIVIPDVTIPHFLSIQNNSTIVYGESFGAQFEAEDDREIESYFINDTTNFVINSTGFLNWTLPLNVGEYYVTVSVNDTSGNTNSTVYNLNITAKDLNITANNNSKVYNESDPEFNVTYEGFVYGEDESVLNGVLVIARDEGEAVGIYNITPSNLTSTNYNINFLNGTLEITKATPLLNITGTSPIVYGTESDFSGTGCPDELTCGMNLPNAIYGAGVHLFNYSTEGNENYTSAYAIKELNITQSEDSCNILFNATSPLEYPESFRVWSNCTTEFTIYRNNEVIANDSEQELFAGAYNFSVLRNDVENYSNVYDEQEFTINKATPTLNYYLNSLFENYSVVYPATINVSAFTSAGTLNIFRNGTNISLENNQEIVLGVGYYEYEFNVTGNENYTDIPSEFLYLEVNQSEDSCNILFNATSPLEYPESFRVWSNCTTEFVIYINGNVTGNNSVQSLSVGTYNFSVIRNDTQNYSNIYNEQTFEVIDTISPQFIQIPGDESLVYGTLWNGALFEASDTVALESYFINDTVNFIINSTGFLNWTSPLTVGEYYINVSVNDTSGNTNSTIFNLNITAKDLNITASNNSKVYNESDPEFNVTYEGFVYGEDESVLNGVLVIARDEGEAVGIYNITPSNLTSTNYNINFLNGTLEITKATPLLNITGTSPIVYGTEGNIEGFGCPAQLTCVLYRDDSNVTNPDTESLGAGVYSYIYNTTGNENYTFANSTFELNITRADGNISLILNNEAADLTIIYPDAFNASASTITGQNLILLLNGTDFILFNNKNVSLPAGYYNITAIAESNQNYTEAILTRFVLINKATPLLNITGTSPIAYETESDFSGTGCPDELTCGMNLPNAIYGAGVHLFNYSTEGNENYTSAYAIKELNITQSEDSCNILFNATSPLEYPESFRVWSNCTTEFTIYRNNEVIANDSEQELSAGAYNFSVLRNDVENYSNVYDEQTFIVQDTALPTIEIVSPEEGLMYNNATQLLSIVANDSYLDTIIYNLDGTNTTYLSEDYLTFQEGLNTIHAWANDTSGNSNYTNVSFIVDTTAPQIEIVSPLNASFLDNLTQLLNISSYDIHPDTVWYSLDNGETNSTYTEAQNITFNDGLNNLIVWANDSVGNINVTTISFIVDLVDPIIQFVESTTENGENFQDFIEFNVTAEDDCLESITVYLYNETDLIDQFNSNESTLSGRFENLGAGIYFLNATASDLAGNEGFTEPIEIFLTKTIFDSTIYGVYYLSNFSSQVESTSVELSSINHSIILGIVSDIINSTIINSTLTDVSPITRCTILYSSVTGGSCVDTYINPSNITNSNTTGSIIKNSNVTDSNVTNSNLTDSGVISSSINNSNLTNSIVENSNLDGMNSTDSNISDSNVSNSTIINTNISNATIVGANITDGVVYSGNITYNGTTTTVDEGNPLNITELINYPPLAVLSVSSSGIVNSEIQIDASESSDPNVPQGLNDTLNDSLTYTFYFGDGENLTTFLQSVFHTYGSVGTYNITLVVTDNFGFSSNDTKQIVISPETSPVVGGGSGSSSGGATCKTQWNCTEWSKCVNGTKIRTCSYPTGFCKPLTAKPEESINCTLDDSEETEDEEDLTEETESIFNLITGFVTGNILSSPKNSVIVIIVLVVLGVFSYWVIQKRKAEVPKKKSTRKNPKL